MGKLGGIILLSALALSGCATAPVAVEPAASVVPNPAEPSTYTAGYSADEFFIAGVKLGWQGDKPRNTDLVKAGEAYCAGAAVVTGTNAALVAKYAEAVYCPKP